MYDGSIKTMLNIGRQIATTQDLYGLNDNARDIEKNVLPKAPRPKL